MATSATSNLKEKVQNLPSLLRTALERQAKARIAVARLEAQIAKIEAKKELQDEDDDGIITNSTDDILDDDVALIKLETKLERLKLELSEAEDKAELEFRTNESRVTEGYVKAAVGSDPVVTRLRRGLLDAKEAARIRKATLQRERQLARLAEQEKRFELRRTAVPEDDRLSELRDKLHEASEELILADVEVFVAHATLEAYQILVKTE